MFRVKTKTGKAEQRHCMTEWKQVRKKVKQVGSVYLDLRLGPEATFCLKK